MQHWRKEIAKRRSPFKQTDWEKEYQRLRKNGVSHSQANKYIARKGGTEISIDRGLKLWNSKQKDGKPIGASTSRSSSSPLGDDRDKYQRAVKLYGQEIANRKYPKYAGTPVETKKPSGGGKEFTYSEKVNASRLGISPGEYRAQKEAKRRGDPGARQTSYGKNFKQESQRAASQPRRQPSRSSGVESGYTAHGNKVPFATQIRGGLEREYAQTGERESITPAEKGPGAKWVDDWYSHPETQRRFKQYQGGSKTEAQSRIAHAARAKGRLFNDPNSSASALYDPNTHTVALNQAYGDKAALALPHERVHASGFDERVGPQVKSILGPQLERGQSDKIRAYYNQPEEMYGKLTNLRVKLGLKPGQNVTTEMLQRVRNSKEFGEDILELFPVEKIKKALNTVAEVDQRGDDGSAFARKHTKPMPKWRQDIENRRRWS